MTLPRHARRGVGAVVLLALAGCAGASGALTLDDSFEILQPAPLQVVEPPFEVRWAGDLGPGESFALFVDRGPIAPGESLADAFADECDGDEGCPDEVFLSARGVYVTDGNEVEVPLLMPRGGADGAPDLEVHHVTIVVLDADGTRRGERSWATELRVAR